MCAWDAYKHVCVYVYEYLHTHMYSYKALDSRQAHEMQIEHTLNHHSDTVAFYTYHLV